MIKNVSITYQIKINVGDYKGKTITLTTTLDELEDYDLVDILIDYNYLKSWANGDEYTVLSRDIKLIED